MNNLDEATEMLLAQAIFKAKVKQLTEQVCANQITATAAAFQLDRFHIQLGMSFSREATAEDINVCKN